MNLIRRFFIWASGADPNLMAQPGCEVEQHRYVIFGTLGVFVALLGTASATLTGTLFAPLVLVIGPSIFWGSYVLVLERAIMAGIANRRNGGGARRILIVSIRLALAAAVGLAITTGFALRFFASAIDRSLAEQNLTELNAAQGRVDSLVGGEFGELRGQRARIDADLASKESEVKDAFAIMEAEGAGRRSSLRGPGRLWRADSAHAAALRAELSVLRPRIESARGDIQSRLNSLAQRREEMLNAVRAVQKPGPADRLRVLYHLEHSDPAIRFESLVFLLFLMLIDVTPALVKLLSSERDGYEALLQGRRAEQIATQDAAADIAVHNAAAEVKRRQALIDLVNTAVVSEFAQTMNAKAANGDVAREHPSAAEVIQAILRRDAAFFADPLSSTLSK